MGIGVDADLNPAKFVVGPPTPAAVSTVRRWIEKRKEGGRRDRGRWMRNERRAERDLLANRVRHVNEVTRTTSPRGSKMGGIQTTRAPGPRRSVFGKGFCPERFGLSSQIWLLGGAFCIMETVESPVFRNRRNTKYRREKRNAARDRVSEARSTYVPTS